MQKKIAIGAFALFLSLTALMLATVSTAEFGAVPMSDDSVSPLVLNEGNSGAYFPDKGSG